MTPLYFAFVPDEDRAITADIAKSWEYPREIAPQEVEQGAWFVIVENRPYTAEDIACVLWFVRPLEHPEIIHVHVCGSPNFKGTLGTPSRMMMLECIAELLGAERLQSYLPEGSEVMGIPAKSMRRYLRKRGWQENEEGSYVELGRA